MHKTIRDVTQRHRKLRLQRRHRQALRLHQHAARSKASHAAQREAVMTLAQLMSPMTPHLAEDIWAHQGGEGLIAEAPWPVADEAMLVEDTVTLPIQINGKRRSEITVAKDASKEEVEKTALADDAVVKALDGGRRRKVIVVPGRIVNVVV
jgi:leucyl-tRNA synthetase